MTFRIIIFFLFFLGLTALKANPWEVIVFYNVSSNRLEVNVYPQLEKGKEIQVSFSSSILNQNLKDSIYAVDKRTSHDEPPKSTLVHSPFVIDQTTSSFSYFIDLNRNNNIPTSALIDFKPLMLLNLNEVLFNVYDSTELNIKFNYLEKSTDLGTKSLRAWKQEVSNLGSSKPLATINNISLYSNISKSTSIEQIKDLLSTVHYFEEKPSKNLFIIYGMAGLESGGLALDNDALIYFDEARRENAPQADLDLLVIHELFHWLSPYKINPQLDEEVSVRNWLSEAMPEYLALKFLLMSGNISERDFLDRCEEKLRVATKYSSLSLEELSTLVYEDASVYEAFYTKGFIALFLFDIGLYSKTQGQLSLESVLLNKLQDIDVSLLIEMQENITELEREFVVCKEKFPLNKYLALVGLIYEKQVLLPMNAGDQTATVKKENISFNKMASAEQKSAWQGFIKH